MPSDGSSSSTGSTNFTHPCPTPLFHKSILNSWTHIKTLPLNAHYPQLSTARAALLGLYLGDEDPWLMNAKGMAGVVTAPDDAEAQGTPCFHQVDFLKGTRSRVKGNEGYHLQTTNANKHRVGVFCMGKNKVNTHGTRGLPMWDSTTWRRATRGL